MRYPLHHFLQKKNDPNHLRFKVRNHTIKMVSQSNSQSTLGKPSNLEANGIVNKDPEKNSGTNLWFFHVKILRYLSAKHLKRSLSLVLLFPSWEQKARSVNLACIVHIVWTWTWTGHTETRKHVTCGLFCRNELPPVRLPGVPLLLLYILLYLCTESPVWGDVLFCWNN